MQMDNVFDYVTLIITALFGLGGIMLQSMETFKNFAIYRGDERGSTASKSAIAVVGMALNIMVVAVFIIFAIFWLHSLWLKREQITAVLRRVAKIVGKRCPCVLRCARRFCPKRCCVGVLGDQKRVRATALRASSFSPPATTPSTTGVEMTPCETKGSDDEDDGGASARGSSFAVWGSLQSASANNGDIEAGSEGGGLKHTNPLYPQYEPAGGEARAALRQGRAMIIRAASTRAVSQVARDEALDEETPVGEGRARRDTLNPAFSESKEMTELNSRDSRQMELRRKMSKKGSIEL